MATAEQPATKIGRRALFGISCVVLAVSGCSNADLTSPVPRTVAAAPTSNASPPPTIDPDGGYTIVAGGQAHSSGGDQAGVVFRLGTPINAASATDPAVARCSPAIQGVGSSLARSVAVPVEVTVTLVTNSPVFFYVDLSFVSQIDDQGNVQPIYAETTTGPLWISEHGNDCTNTIPGNAVLRWNNLQQEVPQTWRGFMIATEAATPNSPPATSSGNRVASFVLGPSYGFGSTSDVEGLDIIGQNVVVCGSYYLAVNPAAVRALGCR